MSNKYINVNVRDNKHLREHIESLDWHIYRERLKAVNLPSTPSRISFLIWLEHQALHIFTFDDYLVNFNNGNQYRDISKYLSAGFITSVFYEGTEYFVSAFATDKNSPFNCKCCGNINVRKLLATKEIIN